MRKFRDRLRLIWADKIVLWLAVLIVAAMAILWIMVAVAAGTDGANHVVASFGSDFGVHIIIDLVGLWALLRAIDFIAGGATYRMFSAQTKPEAASTPAAQAPSKPMAAT